MAKIIAKNKNAFFNYEILDILEAGIELNGAEIKSIRLGKVSLKGAFVNIKKDEAFIMGMHISQYMNTSGDEMRTRKLLLHKKQILKLKVSMKTGGLTVVATTLKWSSKGYVKVDIALAKGKSKIDKRQVIKKRDVERKIQKAYNI